MNKVEQHIQIVKWWSLPTTVVIGAIFWLLLEVFISPINAFGFSFGSLHLVYVIIIVLTLDLLLGIGSYKRFLLFGLLVGGATQAIGSYIGTGGQAIAGNASLSTFSILFIAFILVIISLIGVIGRGWTTLPIWPIANRTWRYGGAILLLLIFGTFRISQTIFSAIGVPNELRSLIVGTIEIHHLITGLMLLIFLVPLSHSPLFKIRAGSTLRFFMVVAFGLIADQISYFALPEINDEIYFGNISLIGGILATGCGMVWFLLRQTLANQLRREK